MMTVRAVEKGTGRIRTGRIGGGSGSGGVVPAFQADFPGLTSLPSWLSLSRATAGTYFDASGVLQTAAIDAPRFDHAWNGSAWVAKGLLIEEQRTNSILQSNNLTDAVWNKISLSITSGVADPDGGTSAFTLTATANNAQIYQPAAGASGAASFWIRRRSGTGQISNRINGSADVALSVTSAWQRLSDVGTGGGGLVYIDLVLATSGDAIDVCRCQLEIGATFPTSYIPTTTAAVTRSADIVQLTGAADALLQAAAASVVLETNLEGVSNSSRLLGQNDGNGFTPLFVQDATTLGAYDGNVVTTPVGGGVSFAGNVIRSGVAWDAANTAIVSNGGAVATMAHGFSLPAGTYLFSNVAANSFTSGWLSKLAIYSSRLSDADLQTRSVVGAAF